MFERISVSAPDVVYLSQICVRARRGSLLHLPNFEVRYNEILDVGMAHR